MGFKIVKDHISRDLVTALEQLLHDARAGEITGIAFACTLKRQRFTTNVAGYCYQNPAFARGAVAFLSDDLAGMVNGVDDNAAR